MKDFIYLCDIDGTVSDFRHHRGPFEEHKVINDIPLPTVNIIKSLIQTDNRIIYFSGRSTACYNDTCIWIQEYIGHQPELYMREKGDNRGDEIVKLELYNKHIKDKYEVIGVFDDRLKVIRMWERLGLWVWNCNQGLIEF